MAQCSRIVQLSDLHLTKNDNDVRTETKLFGKLKGMNQAFRRVIASKPVREADLILVTGDVTDRGDLEAWKVFWDGVNAAGVKDKILVLPGNHDMCCLGMRFPKASGYAEEDLEKARKGLILGNQPCKFPWTWPDSKKATVAVFSLNSSNLGCLTAATNALGDIGFYQLLALSSKLHTYRDVPVKIVALHHSPNIPEEDSEFTRLASQIPAWERRSLRLLCVAHGVRLIVHGHLHRTENRRVNGIRIVGAPATTEPHTNGGQKPVYSFWTYKIAGKSNRVSCKLISIPADGQD
jgi:3',5'-cyclic AMP phosphodiesterase CpdA